MSGGSTTNERDEIDHHQLQVEADLDNISTYADTDAEEEDYQDSANNTWHTVYTSNAMSQTVREYFMSRFYRYLVHVEGGAHSRLQALIHTCQVHIILNTLDAAGTDLACLACRRGLDVWDKFCVLKLSQQQLAIPSRPTSEAWNIS